MSVVAMVGWGYQAGLANCHVWRFSPPACQWQPSFIGLAIKCWRALEAMREVWSLLTTYRKSYMVFSKNPLLDLAEIHHLGSWHQNTNRWFSQKLINLELQCLLTTYRKSYMGFSKKPLLDPWNPRWLRSAVLKINMTSFFCRGWSDLDNISQTGTEWHADCSDMVEIKTRCRIPIWRTFGPTQWYVIPEPPPHCRVLPPGKFNVMIPELRVRLQGAATGRIQWHVIPEPRITLQGAVTWWNQCHDRATLQGVRIPSAILQIVFHHILFYLFF